jgi:branched-chain amino acid transport system permease protein
MSGTRLWISLLVAAAACILTLMLGRFGNYLMHAVVIASISALALNLLTGFCGQISFAQAALLGVGAYTAGNLGNAGWGILSIPLAGMASAAAGALIGLPALRLRGLYFAMATLAAQFIFDYAFKILDPLTHGVSGLVIKPLTLLGYVVQSDRAYAVIAIICLFVTWLTMVFIGETTLGRAFLVVRANEIVAKGMGIDVARTKLWAFAISGFFAGVAGALLAFTTRLASPEAFGLSLSIDYVAMIIVGGLGSLPGSLLGAAFVTLLPELIQRVGEALNIADILSAAREMAFGLLIIVFLIFEPRGLSALLHRLTSRDHANIAPKTPRPTSERRRSELGLKFEKVE